MAFRKIYDGLRIIAKALGTSSKLGDIESLELDPGEGYMTLHNGVSASEILTADHDATVTNKTISGSSNTLTDINGDSLVDNSVDLVKLSKVGNNRILYSSINGDIGTLDQLTSQKVVITDSNGIPTTATASTAEVDYLVGVTSGIQDQLNSKLPLGGGTMTGSLDMDDNSITNIPDPVSNKDAVNKQYVDAIAQGLDLKSSVRVATTTSGTLSSSFENGDTVDGVVLATNDRILIKNQVSEVENGIYIVQASGSPLRSSDADTWTKLVGAFCFVEEGTTNGDTGWACNINATGTIGVNDITFVQFSAAGVAEAGAGLTKTGTTFSVNVDNSTTEISGNNVIVKAGGVTDTQVNASAAIGRSKLASGTASHVIINDGSGVLSSEATLAKSRGGSGQDNSSLTFPATGTLATLAGTEVLTNKDFDGGTASNSSRLTLPKNTKANLDSLNRKEGTVVYATDQAKAFIDNGTSLVQIGSGSGGGGINYILNPDAEVNTDGWTSTRRTIVGNSETTSDVYDTAAKANPYTFTENEPLISFNVNGLTAGTTYYSKNATAAETQFSSTPGGAALNIGTGIDSEVVSPNFRGFYIGSSVSTWTRSETDPLRGEASFLLTKPASLCVGDVHYYAFTIDDADKAKVMQIGFDYVVASGTYSTGDVIVRIRDVTNDTIIQPSAYQIENVGVASTARLTFQTASNSNNYELIFNIATVSTSAYSLKFDNITLGPQVVPMGAPVTDWVSYTPTLSWVSNATASALWRRVGDSLEVTGRVLTSGTPTSAELTISLPSGLSIDAAKLVSTTRLDNIGEARVRDDSGTAVYDGFLRYASATTVAVLAQSTSGSGNTPVNATVPFAWEASDTVTFEFRVPIVGWSSSTVVSSSANTRVVAMRAYRATNQTGIGPNNSFVKLTYDTADFDTAGCFDSANSRFTVRVPGQYRIAATAYIASTNTLNNLYGLVIYKNGSVVSYGEFSTNSSVTTAFSRSATTDLRLVAGDYIEIYLFGQGNNSVSTLTMTGGIAISSFSVDLIQGPSQIAASEVIAVSCVSPSGSVGLENTVVFTTKVFDTHNAYNTSTGVFTAPAPGIYEFKCYGLTNSITLSTSGALQLYTRVDGGSSIRCAWTLGNGANFNQSVFGTALISLQAGQTVEFRQTSSASGTWDSGRYSVIRLGGVL